MKDKRPDPKPRRHPHLWQAYLWWNELMQMCKRHKLRLSSIEKGKSNLDAEFERLILEDMESLTKRAQREMVNYGKAVGPIWDWLTSIRGVGDHTAAKLLALIDDPARFSLASKLVRYCGLAVKDGKAERRKRGEKSPFDARLKSELLGILGSNFIRHQTPTYVDIYYEEKARLRRKFPEPMPNPDGPQKLKYTDGHVHYMARRKMVKVFVHHLWAKWRELEGLPATEPYAQAVLGHTNIIPVPVLEQADVPAAD